MAVQSAIGHAVSNAITVLDYLHAPAVGFYFIAAVIYGVATLQKPSSKAANGKKRRFSLFLMLLVLISYIAQGIYYLVRAFVTEKKSFAPQHSIIHVLGSILVWTAIHLALSGQEEPAWSPYIGSWVIGALVETTLCILSNAVLPGDVKYHHVLLVLQAFRIACFFGLLITAAFLILAARPEKHADEEHQSLLGNTANGMTNGTANGSTNGSATNGNKPTSYGTTPTDSDDENSEPEDRDKAIKEKQRKRLEEQGGWIGYLKGFALFLPYLWPKDDWKAQVCLLIMGFDIVQDRFLNVLIPRQVGIITDKLTGGGSMPWREVLIWTFLQWLASFAGFGMIKDAVSSFAHPTEHELEADIRTIGKHPCDQLLVQAHLRSCFYSRHESLHGFSHQQGLW
jgi:hypothetical protein